MRPIVITELKTRLAFAEHTAYSDGITLQVHAVVR